MPSKSLTRPATIFKRVVFPAPEAPIITLTSPPLKIPEIPSRIIFVDDDLPPVFREEPFDLD